MDISSRELVAYALIVVLVVGGAAWAVLRTRRRRIERQRRHGPRLD